MNIFECFNYKKWIKLKIEENAQIRGYQTHLAEAAGCSRSFLSQALSTDIDLTRDHLASLCHFWRLKEDETDYFLSLLDVERAKSSALKAYAEKRLAKIRDKQSNLSNKIAAKTLTTLEEQSIYYNSWHFGAIHMLLCIPGFDNSQTIAKRLLIPVPVVDETLQKLKEMKIIELSNGRWLHTEKDLNLSRQSVFSVQNHVNWRLKAISELQLKSDSDSLHYSSVFAISVKDAQMMRQNLAGKILDQRAMIAPSKEEDIYCFNCDFFRV